MARQDDSEKLNIRVPLRLKAELRMEAERNGESLSSYCRAILADRDAREQLEQREKRIEQLEDQLTRRSQIESKIEDLPDKIRERETYQERRQRKIDEASFSQRLKWRFTGVPVDTEG